jgi:hypothetical protein
MGGMACLVEPDITAIDEGVSESVRKGLAALVQRL